MNFNPMDLIHVKEHFEALFNKEELHGVEKFIDVLIQLQAEKEEGMDTPLKDKLGAYFFNKQDLIEIALGLTKRRMK